MGFLPELKVDGMKMAQLTPMLVYLSKVKLKIPNRGSPRALGTIAPVSRHFFSKSSIYWLLQIGKMDKLDPMEEFKSGMMLQTATDVFSGSVGPAFGVIGGLKDEPREKQCAAFHAKAVEGLKGLLTNFIFE